MKAKSIVQAKVQETNTKNLIECLFKENPDINNNNFKIINCPKREKIEVLAEINRRFGMPLYIPIIALLCSFLLINREESKNNYLFKYFFGGSSFLLLVVAEILVRYSGMSFLFSIIYYLVPLLLIPFLYYVVKRQFSLENFRK